MDSGCSDCCRHGMCPKCQAYWDDYNSGGKERYKADLEEARIRREADEVKEKAIRDKEFKEYMKQVDKEEAGKEMRDELDRREEELREDQKRQQEELQQLWESGITLTKPRTLKTAAAIAQDNGSTYHCGDDEVRDEVCPLADGYPVLDNEYNVVIQKPIGINPKDLVGAKKVDIALVPPSAIVEIAKCMQDGAKKYGAYNWREEGKPVQEMTYLSAALRHLLAYIDGEDCAQDSGHSHIAHAMAGLAVLTDAKVVGNSIDNRPVSGKTGELLNV